MDVKSEALGATVDPVATSSTEASSNADMDEISPRSAGQRLVPV